MIDSAGFHIRLASYWRILVKGFTTLWDIIIQPGMRKSERKKREKKEEIAFTR